MFGISGFELLLIVAFVLLIFGPDKLPELGRLAGKAASTFKRAQEDMERVIRAEVYAPGKSTRPEAGPDAPVTPDPKAAAETANAIWSVTDEGEEEDEE